MLLPFGDGAARSLGAIQRFKVPHATPRTPPRTTIKCEDRLLCGLREQHQDLNRLNDNYKSKTKN